MYVIDRSAVEIGLSVLVIIDWVVTRPEEARREIFSSYGNISFLTPRFLLPALVATSTLPFTPFFVLGSFCFPAFLINDNFLGLHLLLKTTRLPTLFSCVNTED